MFLAHEVSECRLLFSLEIANQVVWIVLPYSGLFSWVEIFVGGNFREKLDKAPRIKFRGFKFRGPMGGNINL